MFGQLAKAALKNAVVENFQIFAISSKRSVSNLTAICGSSRIFQYFDKFSEHVVLPPVTIAKRFFPKPRKSTRYKYDWREFENKEYTADPLQIKRLGGRDPLTGKKYNQRVGGGVKFDFFWITAYPYIPHKGGFYEERILEVRHDPNRTAFIALLAGQRGRRWTIACEDWEAGDVIRTTNHIPDIPLNPRPKEAWPVGALAENTTICMVEMIRGARDFEEIKERSAGTSATIMGRRGDTVIVKLSNQQEVLLDRDCMCTVGRVSNPQYDDLNWGSMNMKRRMGIKQGSGLWHRKDGYCGRKIRPLPPPMIPVRRDPPPKRYVFTLDVAAYQSGFGTNEFNPVLKGH